MPLGLMYMIVNSEYISFGGNSAEVTDYKASISPMWMIEAFKMIEKRKRYRSSKTDFGKNQVSFKKMSFQYGEKKPNTVAGFNWNGSVRGKFWPQFVIN